MANCLDSGVPSRSWALYDMDMPLAGMAAYRYRDSNGAPRTYQSFCNSCQMTPPFRSNQTRPYKLENRISLAILARLRITKRSSANTLQSPLRSARSVAADIHITISTRGLLLVPSQRRQSPESDTAVVVPPALAVETAYRRASRAVRKK
jgi:hypothetical protein